MTNRISTAKPIIVPPTTSSRNMYAFNNGWHQTLFGSFTPCPTSAFACFCNPCYVAKLNNRAGEHACTCCINPCALMALRTKVRTAFHIRGTLPEDCCYTNCCLCSCAAMQIEKELNHQGIPNKTA